MVRRDSHETGKEVEERELSEQSTAGVSSELMVGMGVKLEWVYWRG